MPRLRAPRAQRTFAAVAKRAAAIIILTAQADRLELGVTMVTWKRLLSFDTSSLSDDFSGGRFDR
jgi:hypothetical protein